MTLWFPQVGRYPGNLIRLHIITVSSLGNQEWNVYHDKGCNAAVRVDCLTMTCSRSFVWCFRKSFQVLVEKHLQLALSKRCAILKTLTYFSTSSILMNKAQNAQIQVNSHVVFTVYCHYLHDLENSDINNTDNMIAPLLGFHGLFLLSQLRFLSFTYIFLLPSVMFCFSLPWG